MNYSGSGFFSAERENGEGNSKLTIKLGEDEKVASGLALEEMFEEGVEAASCR